MKPKNLPWPKQHARSGSPGLLRRACAVRLLLLLLLTLPAVAQAQFNYTTNNGTITITSYTGPGGAVAIPDTIDGLPVTRIGDYTFYNNFSLTSVTIPSSVTSIGDSAFMYCTSLTAITVDADNATYGSVDGVLFNKSQTTLIQCPEGKTGNYTIPSSITSIGGGAFHNCTSLTTVTIPSSVTSIEYYTFSGCTSLASITIPSSVTYIGERAFGDCTSLANVTIPSSVTRIGEETFYGCTSLASVTIPSGVTSIEGFAFSGCTSLTSVTIPSGVTSIGFGAFGYCTSLNGVYFQGNAPSGDQDQDQFLVNNTVIVYYLPGTTGWGPTFGDRPTALWVLPNPLILNNGPSFGVQTDQFGFIISWATNLSVVVEACTDLTQPLWTPVGTNTLTDGSSYFSDPQWTNFPSRFYRLRSP